MIDRELLELNSEILRSREMDYYRYHSFLNGISESLDKFNITKDKEEHKEVLDLTREIIRNFTKTYGVKRVPNNVRSAAQEIIISKEWNFN
jgi:hypothetical protein